MSTTSVVTGASFSRTVQAAGVGTTDFLQFSDNLVVVNIAGGQRIGLIAPSASSMNSYVSKRGVIPNRITIDFAVNGTADVNAITIIASGTDTINGVTDPINFNSQTGTLTLTGTGSWAVVGNKNA